MELATYDAFSSVREANRVAHEILKAEFDEESRINEVEEEVDPESTTTCYRASVRLFQDGLDTYAVAVKELEMNYPRVPKPATRAFNAGPAVSEQPAQKERKSHGEYGAAGEVVDLTED
jgi:hypothetical protein